MAVYEKIPHFIGPEPRRRIKSRFEHPERIRRGWMLQRTIGRLKHNKAYKPNKHKHMISKMHWPCNKPSSSLSFSRRLLSNPLSCRRIFMCQTAREVYEIASGAKQLLGDEKRERKSCFNSHSAMCIASIFETEWLASSRLWISRGVKSLLRVVVVGSNFLFRQSLYDKFACDGTDGSPSSRASWQEINPEECRKNANLLQRARHDRGDLS